MRFSPAQRITALRKLEKAAGFCAALEAGKEVPAEDEDSAEAEEDGATEDAELSSHFSSSANEVG